MAAEHVASRRHRCVRLLADHGEHEDLLEAAAPTHANASSLCSMASRVTITVSAMSRSRTERFPASVTWTSAMLRALFSSIALCEHRTTSTHGPHTTCG